MRRLVETALLEPGQQAVGVAAMSRPCARPRFELPQEVSCDDGVLSRAQQFVDRDEALCDASNRFAEDGLERLTAYRMPLAAFRTSCSSRS